MMAKANERLNELLRIKPFPPLRTEGLREGVGSSTLTCELGAHVGSQCP